MIKCYRCNQLKSKNNFRKDKNRSNGFSSYCRTCSNEYSKEYLKKNRAYAVAYVNRVKGVLGCYKCNTHKYYLIEFHHIDSEIKENSVAQIAHRSSGNHQ